MLKAIDMIWLPQVGSLRPYIKEGKNGNIYNCKLQFEISNFRLYVCIYTAQSVLQLATGWMVQGSNLSGGKVFHTCPDRPWGPPIPLYNGYRFFPGVKTLTTHPHLVPKLKEE